MAKKISVKTVISYAVESANMLACTWKDGVEAEYDFNKLPDTIKDRALYEAIKSKIFDAHSALGEKGAEACREATDAVWDNLLSGDWNRGREGVGGWIVECLADLALPQVVTLGQAKEAWEGLSDDDKKVYAKMPQVKAWKAARDLKAAKKAMKDTEPSTSIADMFADGDK